MNPLTDQQMEQHIDILGWLHVVLNALFLAVGLGLFVLLAGIGAFSGDAEAAAILTVFGIVVATIMSVLGLPGLLAGYGLLKRRSWGRLLAVVLAILGLVNFPLGTALGVYTLWVLFQPIASGHFDGHPGSATPAYQ